MERDEREEKSWRMRNLGSMVDDASDFSLSPSGGEGLCKEANMRFDSTSPVLQH